MWDDGLEALVGVRVHTDDGRGGTVERSAVEEVAQKRARIMAKREAKKNKPCPNNWTRVISVKKMPLREAPKTENNFLDQFRGIKRADIPK